MLDTITELFGYLSENREAATAAAATLLATVAGAWAIIRKRGRK